MIRESIVTGIRYLTDSIMSVHTSYEIKMDGCTTKGVFL